MNGGNNNNNNNNNQGNYNGYYYIGPYCSPKDGFSIFLGIFFDAACISHANSTVYAEVNGADLPYANKSMVSSECIDCKKQNNNNNNGYDEAYDSCIELYAASAKCESKMSIANPDTSACDFLSSVLPTLDTASRAVNTGASTSNKSKSGKGAKAFATIFAFTTVVFSAYSYFLYRKIKRGSVDLSSQV